MTPEQSYAQLMKEEELYTVQGQDDVSLMVSYGDANKHLNSGLAQWAPPLLAIVAGFRGRYLEVFQERLGVIVAHMEQQYSCIDGQTRKDAIMMKGEGVREAEKKSGIKALFSGADK
jgi:hypothetical protein